MSRDMTDSEAISNLNHIYGIVSSDIQRSLDVAFKAITKCEWIPVSKRLPDKDGCYLVTLEGVEDYELVDDVDIARFVFSEKDDCNNGFKKAYIVTAWQPLPEPYKSGGKE